MAKNVKSQFGKSVSISYKKEKPESKESQQDNRIRLADFIHVHTEQIVIEWESFARTLIPAATDMTSLALRNHIHQILAFIVSDMRSSQTRQEQIQKSHGEKEKSATPTAAETHAALRLAGGFNIDQMVSEYRALRASVVKLWCKTNTQMNAVDITDLTRFHESIDQELAESVSHYTQKVSFAKDLFMGVLSHDLRSPLNVISMSAQLMLNIGMPKERQPLSERQTMLATQIFESTSRITELVNNLLDVTRARFGSGTSITRTMTDMGFISRLLVGEMQAAYPTRTINLNVSGNLKGEWDKARIGQVFSNLIGNAIQYSFKDTPIDVTVKGTPEEVLLSVHNEGIPVPAEKFGTLFDSFTRMITDEGNPTGAVINLGLGLYIAKDIVVSHGGTIGVTSTEEDGTTFTVRLPRSTIPQALQPSLIQ